MKLLIATRNRGKVIEIKELLQGLPCEIIDESAFPNIPDIEETGETFTENALIKGRYYHSQTGLLTVADDSGLVVDALAGAPGVYSARYAGERASDQERIRKLLKELEGAPWEKRTARFVCAVALVGESGLEEIFTGTCEGMILAAPRGTGGFGYDPVFEYPPLGKTFAELSRQEKSAVSHRGRALAGLRSFLEQAHLLNGESC